MSSERLGYMKWVTNNVGTFIPNQSNLVACVYCRKAYNVSRLRSVHNCLVCQWCGVDAVMVIEYSPLRGLAPEKRQELLDQWHIEGFVETEEN